MVTETHTLASAGIKSPLDLIYWAPMLLLWSHQFLVVVPSSIANTRQQPLRNHCRAVNEAMHKETCMHAYVFKHAWINPDQCTLQQTCCMKSTLCTKCNSLGQNICTRVLYVWLIFHDTFLMLFWLNNTTTAGVLSNLFCCWFPPKSQAHANQWEAFKALICNYLSVSSL